MSRNAEIAIIGAGMAGASLAAEIGKTRSVLLLEAEEHPGYHATGRSAAFWSESFGGPLVQPLTKASGPFLSDGGFLTPRRALYIAEEEGRSALDRLAAPFANIALEPVEPSAFIPGLKPHWQSGLLERSCCDIDVAALHAFYLTAARSAGVRLHADARVTALEKGPDGWRLDTTAGKFSAGIIVNAAGAWADDVARLAGVAPIGLQPYRRTVIQLRIDPPAPSELPLVLDALGRFYFKPEAGGRLWLSPQDETACDPCDAAHDEQDVARAIHWLHRVVDWRVGAVERRWAGLRSFAPDRLPVYGFAPGRSDFFWCAGQGGFGIQTAPAAAKLAAALLLRRPAEGETAAIDPSAYLAERFAN